jgi:hypothetical protein
MKPITAAIVLFAFMLAAPAVRAGQAGGNAPAPNPAPGAGQGTKPNARVIRQPATPRKAPGIQATNAVPTDELVPPGEKDSKLVQSGDAYSFVLTANQRKLLDGSYDPAAESSGESSSIKKKKPEDQQTDEAVKLWSALAAFKKATEFTITDAEEPVVWLTGVKRVFAAALKKQLPFAVYVADEQHFLLAGEGAAYWQAWKVEHAGTSPSKTVFECAEVRQAFATAGVAVFVKVESTPQDDEMLQQAGFGPNTLLLYAPDGERLGKFSGDDCQPRAVAQFLEHEFVNKIEAWRAKQAYLHPSATEAAASAPLVQPEGKQP